MEFIYFFKKLDSLVFNFPSIKRSLNDKESQKSVLTQQQKTLQGNFQLTKEFGNLSEQIGALKRSLKVRETFVRDFNRRYQESIVHTRELIEISNKISEKSNKTSSLNFNVSQINLQVEETLKNLEQGCFAPLIISSVNLQKFIEEMIDFFRPELIEKNVKIRKCYKSKQHSIESDSLLLKEIFIYFFKKIFSRLPKNGSIEIDIHIVKGNVKITLRDSGYYLDESISNVLFKNNVNSFLAKDSLQKIMKKLRGEVKFFVISAEKHETIVLLPLKYEETEILFTDNFSILERANLNSIKDEIENK